jgi:hypothetical protein
MPRKTKGARLWLRSERRDKTGQAMWFILDGNRQIATGCAASEIAKAESQLASYIAAKHEPIRRRLDIEEIDIADVISIYVDDRKVDDESDDARRLFSRLERLNSFWGSKETRRHQRRDMS